MPTDSLTRLTPADRAAAAAKKKVPRARRAYATAEDVPAHLVEVAAALPPLARYADIAEATSTSRKTWQRLVNAGRIRAVRSTPGTPVLIPRAEVIRYLLEHST